MKVGTGAPPRDEPREGLLVRVAGRFAKWAERWFPDAFIFVALIVVVVAVAAMLNGASPIAVSEAFGDGFWSLTTFTMQMAFVAIGGYVVATSPPAARLINWLAGRPTSGVGAIGLVATVSMLASLLNWGLSLVIGALLVRALAARSELRMDYRAAAAAAYLGLGATWAMGLSSSAAQLQANAASIPPSLLSITGLIPFQETIFLWQSVAVTLVLIVVSVPVAVWSAPRGVRAKSPEDLGIHLPPSRSTEPLSRTQPSQWLEHSPILTVLVSLLAAGWLAREFARQDWITAASNLGTYNFAFIMLGLLLHWRPRRFLDAVVNAVPAVGGVLLQFPFYGAVAAMLTQAANSTGQSLADQIATGFLSVSTQGSFPIVVGLYSAVLGLFVPSGGGKWLLEAPYVMQAANDLEFHLGWTVQIYNAAEALPNLVNPFWMLPLLGLLGLRAKDIVGYTSLQLVVHLPLVLFLLWVFSFTLDYRPPVMP